MYRHRRNIFLIHSMISYFLIYYRYPSNKFLTNYYLISFCLLVSNIFVFIRKVILLEIMDSLSAYASDFSADDGASPRHLSSPVLPEEDTIAWLPAAGCRLVSHGLLLPNGTLYSGGQFRIEDYDQFPDTRYCLIDDAKPPTLSAPPPKSSVIMLPRVARDNLQQFFQTYYPSSLYLVDRVWDSATPVFLLDGLNEPNFFNTVLEAFHKDEKRFLKGQKEKIPDEAKPFLLTFPKDYAGEFVEMLQQAKLEGRSSESQLGGDFCTVPMALISAESKRRWHLASCLSVLTILEGFAQSPKELSVDLPAAGGAKLMFGVVFQAIRDWAESKIDIRKKVLKDFDPKFEPVARLLFSSIFCPSIFAEEEVEALKEISLSRGLSLRQILKGKQDTLKRSAPTSFYQPYAKKPRHQNPSSQEQFFRFSKQDKRANNKGTNYEITRTHRPRKGPRHGEGSSATKPESASKPSSSKQ